MLRLQERQQVVVGLGLALQALQGQLEGRELPVLLLQLADLTIEELFAVAQHRDLSPHLAAHLGAHLADPVVESLQARVPVGDLQGEIVALELELRERALQLLHRRVGGLDEDPVGGGRRVEPGQALLDRLELGALMARLLDVAADLGEQRHQHGRLGAGRDDPVRLAERPDLRLGAARARLDVLQLVLDEAPRLGDARVPQGLVVVAVGLGGGVGEVLRLARLRRGRRDLEDARVRHPVHSELAVDRIQRRPVALRLARGRAGRRVLQVPQPLGDLLEDRVALDDRDLRLDRVGARVREDLDQEPRELGGLLELDRGRRLVDRNFLLREAEAQGRDQQGGDDDDHAPPAHDQPVVAEIHLVLRH